MKANQDYIDARNRLIPIAERHANAKAGVKSTGDRDEWVEEWNYAFHTQMDLLAKEQGLV